MLDTTLFNDVLRGEVSAASFADLRLLVTGIQPDELGNTNNAEKRANLLAVYRTLNPEVTLASSFAFDIEGAGLDQANWNDGSGNYEKMLDRLRELDGKNRWLNQERDILIAETAIKNGATLVSNDARLRQVVSEFGGRAIDHLEFEREALSSGQTDPSP
jgi:predicted nucleic acid-binding protein